MYRDRRRRCVGSPDAAASTVAGRIARATERSSPRCSYGPSPTMLEATHGFAHQLRRSAQVPLGVRDMNVPEKRTQKGKASFGVLLRAVPVHQRCRGKSMAKIVQTRPMTVARAAQTDAPRSR